MKSSPSACRGAVKQEERPPFALRPVRGRMEDATAREGTIATRLTAARLCTVLGVAVLAAALVLALLPGSPAACGSLLAPMYPSSVGVECAGAQVAWLPEVLIAGLVGLLLLGVGAAVVPSRRTRRRR